MKKVYCVQPLHFSTVSYKKPPDPEDPEDGGEAEIERQLREAKPDPRRRLPHSVRVMRATGRPWSSEDEKAI